MGGLIDEVMKEAKLRKDKHYRLTRADDATVSIRKARGYENVSPQDSEAKGTILEKSSRGDGTVRVGNLILQSVPKERHDELKKEVEARTQRQLDAIKHRYLEDGERIKRGMGKSHKNIKFIHESKEE